MPARPPAIIHPPAEGSSSSCRPKVSSIGLDLHQRLSELETATTEGLSNSFIPGGFNARYVAPRDERKLWPGALLEVPSSQTFTSFNDLASTPSRRPPQESLPAFDPGLDVLNDSDLPSSFPGKVLSGKFHTMGVISSSIQSCKLRVNSLRSANRRNQETALAVLNTQLQLNDLSTQLKAQNRTEVASLRITAEDSIRALQQDLKTLQEALQLPIIVDNRKHLDSPPLSSAPAPLQVAASLALLSRYVGGAPRNSLDLLMKGLAIFGSSILSLGNSSLLQDQALGAMPKTYEAIEHMLNLGITTVPYAVCPTCHCLHEPTYPSGSTRPSYPTHCQDKPFNFSTACNTPLLKNNTPIKLFEYYSFLEWHARFTADPKVAQWSKDFYARALLPEPGEKKDFADGSFARSFRGPDGRYFIRDRGEEGRYFYSLDVDFFNVEGNRNRGPSRSMGIIALLCYNIPGAHRDDPPYVYVAGVIPGTAEPSAKLAQLSHYVRPLFRDMATAYLRGTWVAKVPSRLEGELSRSAIAAVVCDAKAARSLGGFTDIMHSHICVQCLLYGQGNWLCTHLKDFTPADPTLYHKASKEWWQQPSPNALKSFTDNYGVRGSALWILPYWNPVTQLVVDPMHTFARIFVSFSRSALQLDRSDDDKPKKSATKRTHRPAFMYPFLPPPQTSLSDAHEIDELDEIDDDDDGEEDEGDILEDFIPNQFPLPFTEAEQILRTEHLSQIVPKLRPRNQKHIAFIHRRLVAGLDPTKDVPEEREKLLTALEKSLAGSSTVIIALRFVCADLNCLPSTTTPGRKAPYVDALLKWRSRYPYKARIWVDFSSAAAQSRVREAISKTVTPSWVGSVPYDFGSKAAGTMKAYQWRILWTIYIPLALVSLWSKASPVRGDEDDLDELLDTAMHLAVTATVLHKRTITKMSALQLRNHLLAHMEGIKLLFPGFGVPSYHTALHIPDFLPLFGPTRNWWCYPFERIIGMLQRMKHNHQYGQLEKTLLHTWYKASQFRKWLARLEAPSFVGKINEVFRHIYGIKGSQEAGFHATNEFVHAAPPDLRSLAGSVWCSVRVEMNGLYYTIPSTHEGNSLIFFTPDGVTEPVPAQICHIYTHGGSTTDVNNIRLAVRRQLPLPPMLPSPFTPFSDFPAKALSDKYSTVLELISMTQVKGHYARWDIKSPYSFIVDLTKARIRLRDETPY